MTVDTFESVKVHLFALQYTIIIELLTWFLVIELALEQADLIIQGLELVKEGTARYWRFIIFIIIQLRFIFVRFR